MSHDAEEVFCDKLKHNSFSIQVDESTDFTNTCYVIAFVRFVNDGKIQEKFWISVNEEYPAIHRKAMNFLLKFSASYMCEQAFSSLTSRKSKDRNCLISVEDEICVCLSQV
jgi:hypothetical protein